MTSYEVRNEQRSTAIDFLSQLPERILRTAKQIPETLRAAALAHRNSLPAAELKQYVETRSRVFHYSARKASQSQLRNTEKPVSEDERLAAHRKVQAALIANLR